MAGLAIGVSSIKSGEHALLHVGWELAYGKDANFSFPNVPPMADLLYEVELIGFDETKKVLTEEEKNPKPLFRRGKAKAELRQMESARDDFRKAQKYAPDGKAIRRELRAVAKQEKAVYQKQKEMYRNIWR